MKQFALTFAATLIIGIAATGAQAYVGPGAGISAIGSFLALIGAVLLAIIGFVWFPVKRMIKRRRGEAEADGAANNNDDQDQSAA